MSAPRPSGKNSVPGTMPTPRSTCAPSNVYRMGVIGEGQPGEEAALRPCPVRSVRHPALERRQHALALAPVERSREAPAARRSNRGEPIPRRAAVRGRLRTGRCFAWRRQGEWRCQPGQLPSRAGLRERRSSTSFPSAPRRPARGSRGSVATRRRKGAHGTPRPRRSGNRSAAPGRRAAIAARRRGSPQPGSDDRGCCRRASGGAHFARRCSRSSTSSPCSSIPTATSVASKPRKAWIEPR